MKQTGEKMEMDLPPFVKRDKPIIVIVHVLKEFGQAAI
jgi:hypothetical protein